MMRTLTLTLVALTALSACTKNPWGNRQLFDGQYFRTQAGGIKEDRTQFVVTVHDAGRSLVGARMAAVTRANQYCVQQFGRSDLTWDVEPEVEDALLPISNGDLIMKGTCDGWQ